MCKLALSDLRVYAHSGASGDGFVRRLSDFERFGGPDVRLRPFSLDKGTETVACQQRLGLEETPTQRHRLVRIVAYQHQNIGPKDWETMYYLLYHGYPPVL
jgi:hypothetical protein